MKAKKSILSMALATAVCISSITGCSSDTATRTLASSNAFGNLNLSVQEYQKLYSNSEEKDQFKALTLLARSQIVAGDYAHANESINEMFSKAKNDVQKDQASIVLAMMQSKQGYTDDAIATLKDVNYKALPRQALSYFLILNSNINNLQFQKTKNPENGIYAFKNQATLLKLVDSKNDRKKVIEKSVSILSAIDEKSLASALSRSNNEIDKGFYEYSIISRTSNDELKQNLLNDFAKRYSDHPVTEVVHIEPVDEQDNVKESNSIANVDSKAIFTLPENAKIAVLLPLSGRFAPSVGEPAKLGILTALKDRNIKANVVFYDTNKESISQIVATLKANGTKLILGPILKPEVTALNNTGIKIPSIVFNESETVRPVNQWYFDLGPNYEGSIAASKIFADQKLSAVVISKNNDQNAKRSATAFKHTFAKTKLTSNFCLYNSASNAKKELSNCPLSEVQAVYLNASTNDAVSIKPIIPATAQIYLTDKSYMGLNNSSSEFALKGALLGDMPWLLTDSQLKESFMKSLPKANPQVQKIFAAAYDSVAFAYSIEQLANNSEDVLHGLTGDITLGQDGLIETSPMWVELGKLR